MLFCGLYQKKHLWEAVFAGWCFGFGLNATSLFWVSEALYIDGDKFLWMIPFAVTGLPAILAIYHAAFSYALFISRISQHGKIGSYAVAFSCLYSIIEILRGHILSGFPWNLVAYIWSECIEISQIASAIGSYGIGAITTAAACLFSYIVLSKRRLLLPALAFIVPISAMYTYGYIRLSGRSIEYHENIVVRIVQPSIIQKNKICPEMAEKNLTELLALSNSYGAEKITHTIWPESSIPWTISDDVMHIVFDKLRMINNNTILIAGSGYIFEQERNLIATNAMVVKNATNINVIYSKSHLLPFGEYVPFRRFIELAVDAKYVQKVTPGAMDFSPGYGVKTVRIDNAPPFSPLICYEAIFPGEVIKNNDRAQWIINITNDGWFGDTSGPYQHFSSVKFRAIEEGVPIARAANTGISAMIDPYGIEINKLPIFSCGIIDCKLPKPIPSTIYGMYGKTIDLALALLLIAVFAFVSAILPTHTNKISSKSCA
ncbi:apolipoprotein N-acyltransferase [Candidatus Hydrogenosomobacter endosymbioticus]|uniref:Apolipoprotein N-acyltransferase n=2 Tax=Candidatus Hydrogenosomobacter endosymbioticus TaxID=2558174 RepID=A0ABM7V870_9PROT|nr:apolipoprotein N-acyltransferase [Candidatus Hydrogenosomobacter endosymbioticus]